MNACREFQERLSLALDQPLAPEDQAKLREHLASCVGCREFQRDLIQAHELVRSVKTVEPPPWMAAKIMARIRLEAAPKSGFWRRAILPLLLKPQFQVATVLLFCATTYYLVNSRTGNTVDEVMRDLRPPQAEPRQPTREAETAAKPTALQPGERRSEAPRPKDQPHPTEADTPSPRREETVLKKEKGSIFVPPPPATPGPAAAPSPSPTLEAAASGSAVVSAPGRDERANLARASKKAAASEPEGRQDDRVEKLDVADPAAALLVQWEPDDPAHARRLLEQELARFGATLLPEDRDQRQAQNHSQARSLSARLDGQRLPELLARLRRLGSVRPARAQQQGQPSGQLTVLVQW